MRRAKTADAWREQISAAEALGYDTVVMPDHVARTPLVGDQFAPIPALMAAAACTTRMRVSPLVLANDLRNPVLLVREIATIDVLSGGRVDLGLGAGWSRSDYAALGRAFDSPRTRIERLEEAVVLMKRLFGEARVDHRGAHYSVRGGSVWPRPLQQPHPPILVGGRGDLVLSLAARHADIVSIGSPVKPTATNISAERVRSRIELVRAAAAARSAAPQIHLQAELRATGRAADLYQETADRLRIPSAVLRASPYYLYGSIDELEQRVLELREAYEITYLRVIEDEMRGVAPLVARVR